MTLALALAPACGGKLNKDRKTTPGSTGSVSSESVAGGATSSAGGPGAVSTEPIAGGPGTVSTEPIGGPEATTGERGAPGAASDPARKSSARSPGAAGGTSSERTAKRRGGRSSESAGKKSGDAAGAAKPASAQAARARKKKPARPKIVPPDLDLGAADQRRRVEARLAAARAALSGSRVDPDRALAAAREALAADATSIDAVVLMAHAYYVKGHDDTAEVMLDTLYRERESSRQNPNLYYLYGLIYDRTDRPERALNAYTRAVQIDPRHKSALINLGAQHLRTKRYTEAAQIYELLVGELNLKTAVVWTNLGSAYRGRSTDYPATSPERDQLLRQAETAYKRALAADRGYGPAYYNLGLLYLDADPFPGPSGPMDKLRRLAQAQTYFGEYRSKPDADTEMVHERLKQVDKLIKREKKRRKRAASGDNW
ncbi:tetratricopeptide repeat protein [Haliangium sp.]|uniref:tetratricopeptide repeat protein n=1 Tax=Haliangium sp. TaxID=2663208 RepID=UPI003D0F342E